MPSNHVSNALSELYSKYSMGLDWNEDLWRLSKKSSVHMIAEWERE